MSFPPSLTISGYLRQQQNKQEHTFTNTFPLKFCVPIAPPWSNCLVKSYNMSASQSSKAISSTESISSILSLPLELQLQIIPSLSYPDALALKHTHPHFYNLIDTNVRLKVAWLLERKERGLDWPQKMCAMKTDAAFCGGHGEVRTIMAKRRAHAECTTGVRGCEVVLGSTCGGAMAGNRRRTALRFWNRTIGSSTAWLTVWMFDLFLLSFVVNLYFVVKWYICFK